MEQNLTGRQDRRPFMAALNLVPATLKALA